LWTLHARSDADGPGDLAAVALAMALVSMPCAVPTRRAMRSIH